MDYFPPKEITFICKKCNSENNSKIHWKDSILLINCKTCKKGNRVEFKNGKIIYQNGTNNHRRI